MKLVVAIQARTRSTRLPGKVLAVACGRPLLAHMIDRVRLAQEPDAIVVATTPDPSDDEIVSLCAAQSVACFRGDPVDCLDRHLQVGREFGADAVVKIPSDCPLIDPRVVDAVLAAYRARPSAYDYVSNLHPASWPDGNDVELIAMDALERAAHEASDAFDREHTTPFLWSRPSHFRLGNLVWSEGDHSSEFRWVVDWPEDLAVVREIFDELMPTHGPHFGVAEILRLYERRPELAHINAVHRGYDYAASRRVALERAAAAHATNH